MAQNFPEHKIAINKLPSLKSTVESHRLFTKKSLGQNFLFDLNLTDKIARTAGDLSNHTIIEVGPGPGGLTRAILLNNAKKLIVFEHDKRTLPILEELQKATDDRMIVINGDALKIDENAIIVENNCSLPIKIIANLPYNIGTELLFKWLDNIDNIDSMTLMFQKEVADRIAAQPNSKKYGVISILTQFYCHCDVAFDINPAAFYPPPKVTSSVINIIKRREPISDCDYQTLKKVTKTLFQQRRKTLRKSAKNLWENSLELLDAANIDQELRPENLSVEDFCSIAKALDGLQKRK